MKIRKRILAVLLAACLAIPGALPAKNASAQEKSSPAAADGMSLTLEWEDGAGKDGRAYRLREENDALNAIKMKVAYSSTKIREGGYAAGELIITVKGIGAVKRGGMLEAAVGADKASDPNKQRDWSYTWNQASDTYTFTNNNVIEENAVFSGYFELVWDIRARESAHGYSQEDICASFLLPDGDSITTEPLSFENETRCDAFSVHLEQKEMYSAEGLAEGLNPEDYAFIKYTLDASSQRNSRGLAGTPEYVFNVDAGGLGTGAVLISPSLATESLGGNRYSVGLALDTSKEQYVFVAYPKAKYAGKAVQTALSMQGVYYEGDDLGTEGTVELARDEISVPVPTDFSFPDIPGDVYSFRKDTYYDKHVPGSVIQDRGGDLKGAKMRLGTTETFYLEGSVNVPSGDAYSLEIVDDFLYVTQQSGNYRQLTPEDYSFKRIVIPGSGSLPNINGVPIRSNAYPVKVYAALNGGTASASPENLAYEGTIQQTDTVVSLPEGTTAFLIRIEGMEESIQNYSIQADASFHLSEDGMPEEERANLESGQAVNTSFIRIYDRNGKWMNDGFTADNYDTSEINLDLAAKDIDTYGAYLDRERDNLTFYKGEKSNYDAITELSHPDYDGSKYAATYTMGAAMAFKEEEVPERFSLYGILPEGTSLDGYGMEEQIWDVMRLETDGIDIGTLVFSCTPEVIEDYQGSGRTYLALHFDLAGKGFSQTGTIRAVYRIKVDPGYLKHGRTTFQARSAVIIDQAADLRQTFKWPDAGNWDTDAALSADIDRDGSTEEYLSASSAYQSMVFADSSQFQVSKRIKSAYTDGFVQTEIAQVEFGGAYTYRLSIINGAGISSDIVLEDVLEAGGNSEWKGILQGVDLADARSKGMDAEIWYSASETPGDVGGADWSKSLDPQKAKAVAIDFGNSALQPGETLNVDIQMKAPADNSLKEKITENGYKAHVAMMDAASGNETVADDLASNLVQAKMTPPLSNVIIAKEDEISGARLPDAAFALLEPITEEVVAAGSTNQNGYVIFQKIRSGSYILREMKAPDGYDIAADVLVSVVSGGDARITVKDPRKTGTIEVIKSNDLDPDQKIPGASYDLYDSTGKRIQEAVTDQEGRATFRDLEWGNYQVKEASAPKGYELNPDAYDVSISRASVEEVQTIDTEDSQERDVLVELVKYESLTDGTQTDTPIPGCVFELVRKKGETDISMGQYVTDVHGYIQLGPELPYGDYYFRETRAPKGYEKSKNLEFSLSPDSRSIRLTAYNQRKPGRILISKKDNLGNSVEGATYDLYDSRKETILGTYTTDAYGSIDIRGLEWGTYYLIETKAPECYSLDLEWKKAEISGESLEMHMECINQTKKGSVLITKTDEIGKNRLAGAYYSLYAGDGSILQENLVTDSNGEILIENLEWGSYSLKEVQAPAGYGLSSETIRFAVNALNAGMRQSLNVTDPADAKAITLTKRIKADINFDNGDPTFLFKIEGTDINGEIHTYHRMIRFDEGYVAASTDAEGYVTQTATVSGLVAGEYTASEEDTSRYRLESISDIINGTESGGTVTFDLIHNESGAATFINQCYEAQDYSDSKAIANVIKKDRKLTGLKAEWSGPRMVDSGTDVDRALLKITAAYDDGSMRELGQEEYAVSAKFPYINGSYQMEVSYQENGIGKKAYFEVEINLKVKVPKMLKAEPKSSEMETGAVISPDLFDVMAIYSDGTEKVLNSGEYTVSPDTVPDILGDFEVTIKMPIEGIGESEYPETSLTLTAIETPIGKWEFGSPVASDVTVTLYKDGRLIFTGIGDTKKLYYGDYAPWDWERKNVKSVKIDSKITPTSMDRWFSGCSNLAKAPAIPESVTSLNYTFSGCSSLTEAPAIPEGVTSLFGMFSNCSSLTEPPIIPEGVENLNDTFESCSSLTKPPVIPKGVLWMNSTFYRCSSLTEPPIIPEGVTYMEGIFTGCENLTRAPEIPASVTRMQRAFYNCQSITQGPKIPESVTDLSETFRGCFSMTEPPIIPSSVTNMYGAFYSCYGLKKGPDIPLGVENLNETFNCCYSLEKTPDIPASVTSMNGTFGECWNLIQASTIPESVISMEGTFDNCFKLCGDLVINANPSSYSGCFDGTAIDGNILYLTGSSTMLQELLNTKSAESKIQIK